MGNGTALTERSVSVDALDAMLQQIIARSNENNDLAEHLHAQSISDIHWDKLQHLRIVGNTNREYLDYFENHGITRGLYSNDDGSWLLAIPPQNQGPRLYLRRCGPALRSLTVENFFRSAAQLDLGHLTSLTALRIVRCDGLNAVRGLENLTDLTQLELSDCHALTALPGLEQLCRLRKLKIYAYNLTDLPELEQLTGLTHLDLSGCTDLTELRGLEKLSGLTYLDLSRCWHLARLPELEKLTNLTHLYLSHCTWLTELDGLEKLTGLTSLDLSWCNQLTELSGLEGLTSLTYLDVSNCDEVNQLSGLENLTNLTHLDVSSCEELSHLPVLETLTSLTYLNLSGCEFLTELPNLEKLTNLVHLDVSGCNELAELPGLEKLSNLVYLDVSGCDELSQLPGLEKLISLKRLNASDCALLDQLSGLENLTSLVYLDVSNCDGLDELPSLEKLTSLKYLNVSNCALLDQLPGLENLTSLTHLNASGCGKLSRLSGLENLMNLTNLNLSWCHHLSQLPRLEKLNSLTHLYLRGRIMVQLPDSLSQCKNLQTLDLSMMHLSDLPDWVPERFKRFITDSRQLLMYPEIGTLTLFGTIIDTIPDMSIFEQSPAMVAKFFEERKRGNTHPLNEIKVVFLGDGEAGKSHTIARLMNDGGEPDHAVFDGQSTPGIVIRDKEYDLGDRTIRVHYWDFGGQEIMHSMHRIFLTGRTMYVILLNARDDTQSDRAKYWLHNVKSFAPNAPVLLVLNKIDQNESASVDERDLRGRYDKLTQVIKLSARDFSQEEFNDCFTNVLLEEIRKTGFLDAQWPNSWTKVKERLEKMQSHYIMGDAYEDICLECQVNENQENLLHWFNDLGISFCCRDNGDYALKDYVILRPDWITNALYIILFNSLAGARNGLIPHSSIFDILGTAHKNPAIRCTLPNARYNSGDIQYVLGIMRKFNLSFTDGHKNEFIPMLCQQNSMVDVQYYHKDAEILEFNMEFDYLPNNLLHRLMVERYNELDMTAVWRTGARFHFKELGYSAVVVIDGETLRFFIRHENDMHRPNTYLTMLKANVDRIVENMGLKHPSCQLVYKLDGKREEFDFGLLKEMLDARVPSIYSRIQRKQIPIEGILNQSAPDGLEDETKLLDAIRKSCLNLQAEPDYYLKDGESGWGMEDKRNRRIRDDLQMLGYDVKDQTQRGLSGTGRGIGELDMLLYNDRKEPWTIIEALRVSSGAKTEWNKHLDKLVANYNYFGAPCLYLLTYVDSDATDFERIWDGYQRHIPRNDPGKFTYCANSLVVLNAADGPRYIKTAKCQYECGAQMTTAYHIFVLVPRQGETLP